MVWDHLTSHWATWSGTLSKRFPHHPIPRQPPLPHQRDAFVGALAQAHQLTRNEVLETLEVSIPMPTARATMPPSAARTLRDGIWPL